MDTKVLEYLIAIAQEKSITAAADRFLLSRPGLSRHLKNVENNLGAKLFVRTPGGMELTKEGMIFINDAQAILHIEKKLMEDLQSVKIQGKNTIRVMLDQHAYNRFIKNILPMFYNIHPDVKVEYIGCNLVQAKNAVIEGRADLAVTFDTRDHSRELEYIIYSSMDLKLLFPPEYNGTTDMEGFRSCMENGMFLFTYPSGTTGRITSDHVLSNLGIYPSRVLEGDARNCIFHVSQGNVCGIVPSIFCSGDLEHSLKIGNTLYHTYNIIMYKEGKRISPEIQDLMEMIVKKLPD